MRRYFVYGVVSSSLFISNVGQTSVSVAFPVLVQDLNASLVSAGWVISIFQLMSVCAMPIAACLSDSLGRRSTFIICLIMFIVGSVLCSIAPNVGWLIFFRGIQGLGGGGFIPAVAGIASDEFPDERPRYVGLLSSFAVAGIVVGPNVGGWMVSTFGWQSVFWLNVPLGVLELIGTLLLVHPDVKRSRFELDLPGIVFMVGSVSGIMLTLTLLGNASGATWLYFALCVLVTALMFALFMRQERRVSRPIVNLNLLTTRPFREANVYNLIFGAGAFGIFNLIPLYAATVYGMDTFMTGVIMTPRSLGLMVVSIIASFMIFRWGYRRPIVAGTGMLALGIFLISLNLPGISILGIDISPTLLLLLVMTLCGIGAGLAAPAANNACIDLKPESIATITGLRGMFRQMGSAVSVTVATLVLQLSGDLTRGFTIVLIDMAAALLLTIPVVFILPASPLAARATGAAGLTSLSPPGIIRPISR